jgi:hypothetical protein
VDIARILFYTVGRIVAGLIGVFGLAWDVTGDSALSISPNNWGLIGLVAFAAFIVITTVREIELALQQRPKIAVEPISNENQAKLEIHNSGGSATFTVKARGIKGFVQPGLYNMQWESSPRSPNCLIHHDGYESIKVGEISPKAYASSDPSYPIHRGGIMLYQMDGSTIGVSDPAIIEQYKHKELYPTMFKGDTIQKDKCIIKAMITSEPTPLKDYKARYFSIEIDHDHGHKLSFTELSELELG